MDSLVANYASSSEEEEEEEKHHQHRSMSCSSTASSLFYSLPQPKSCDLFSCLPHPKQQPSLPKIHSSNNNNTSNYRSTEAENKSISSSLFSSLPKPKSQKPDQQPIHTPLSNNAKRVVQFKPPITTSSIKNPTNSDDDEDDRKRRHHSESPALQSSSVKSFLSSIPAPKNSSTATLGAVPLAAGSGRRSIIETEALPQPPTSTSSSTEDEAFNVDQNIGNYGIYDNNSASYANYESVGIDHNAYGDGGAGVSYENYYYGEYGNNWSDVSVAEIPQTVVPGESGARLPKKRGRNEIPNEIVEVKQDELMKDRPREDQVKMTGIAFGPSYQPTSTKGKPSKLHKRKHQIGSLYYDMKQKEMELAERRSKGFLTKAETQAKYGW